jgi:hypothetical protein
MVQTARGASLPRIGVALWLPKRRPAAGIDSVARRDNPGKWQMTFIRNSKRWRRIPRAKTPRTRGVAFDVGAAANPWR